MTYTVQLLIWKKPGKNKECDAIFLEEFTTRQAANMGIDINTYRCRVGSFIGGQSAGRMLINFSTLANTIGALTFIRTLLVIAGIEQNPGPIAFKRSLIQTYWRELSTLQVSPCLDGDELPLMDFYKSPTLIAVDYHRNLSEEETTKSITWYEDIFEDMDGQVLNNIFLIGDAGIGKTSFCKHLCLLWCLAQSGDEINYKSWQKDIDYLQRFEYVFYIKLKDTDRKDFIAMIADQLFYTDTLDEWHIIYRVIDDIVRHKSCLTLFDGLDEWVPAKTGRKVYDLPVRRYNDNCVYITTTRPYTIETVRLSRKDMDLQIQITGIHGTSTECYIEAIVNYLNKKIGDNRGPDEFMREVEQCGLDNQLCVSTLVSQLIVLWFDRKLTEMSRAYLFGNFFEILFKDAVLRGLELPPSTSTEIQLPTSLSKFEYLQENISLLNKFCSLSFRKTFRLDKAESTLVFNKPQLASEPYCLSIEEIDLLCKIGIMSKIKMIGFFAERRMKLSFLHRNFMEFLTALYIAYFDKSDLFDDTVKQLSSIKDVLRFENPILHLVGLSFPKVQFLFNSIHLSIDFLSYRKNSIFHSEQRSFNKDIKSLQTFAVNCFKEARRCNMSNISIKLEDFVFDDDSDDSEILRTLLSFNINSVKSIYSVNGTYLDEFDQIKGLHCLKLGKVLSVNYEKFTKCMLQNKKTLNTVYVRGCGIWIPEVPVKHLRHLTSLCLIDVKMKHDNLQRLGKFLTDNVLIENIKLRSLFCDTHLETDCQISLNLPKHKKLKSLCLFDVNMVCNNVKSTSLQSITLCPFSEDIVGSYVNIFNCIKNSGLEHFCITGWSSFDNNTTQMLTTTVKTLPYLKSINICFITFPDNVSLQLHPDVTEVAITLHGVTMSPTSFRCFVDSFFHNQTLLKVSLVCCKITSVDRGTHRELSEKGSVDYMSEYLGSIPTVNITDKGTYWLYFENSKSL